MDLFKTRVRDWPERITQASLVSASFTVLTLTFPEWTLSQL